MSIFYCDNCGEVIQGQLPEDKAIGRETLCASCNANRPGSSARDESSSDSNRNSANEIPQDFSLSSLLKSGELDLFSNDTIARRKQQQSQQLRPSTLVVEENETMTTTRREPISSGGANEVAIDWDKLVPNATAEAGSRPKSGASAEHAATAAPRQQSSPPSAARRQQRESTSFNSDMWRLACLACAAKLSMQPVRKRSRIGCPKCGQRLVVRPDGVLAIESVAIPKSRGGALAHFDTEPQRASDRNSPSATQIGLLERSPHASGAVRKPQLESAAEAAAGGANFDVAGSRPRSPSSAQRKAPRPQLQLEDDSSFADLHAVQSRNASMMSWPQKSAGGAPTEIIGMGSAASAARTSAPTHSRAPSPNRTPGAESMKSPNFGDATPSQPMARPQPQAPTIASAAPAPMAAPARSSHAAALRPLPAARLPKAVAGFAVICWLSMAALPTAFMVATQKPLLPTRWQSQVENFTATVGESARAVIEQALKKLR